MATPARKTGKRPSAAKKAARPKKPTKTRPRLRLAVIRAIIREGLQQARLRLQYEEDGMQRLIEALREKKPVVKRRKAG